MSVILTSHPSFVMRRAVPADRDVVVALANAISEHDYIPESYNEFMAETGPGGLFLGELDGQVIGCYHLALPRPDDAYFSAMRVDPAAQGKGVGSLFCGAQIQHARQLGASQIYLLSAVENATAHRTVQKNGFGNRGEWVIYHGLEGPFPTAATRRTRPATAADRQAIEALLVGSAHDALSGVISAPDSPWVIQSRADEAHQLRNVWLVDGDGGLDGLMGAIVTPQSAVIRLLEGTPLAAAALMGCLLTEVARVGSRIVEASLPARSEHLLARLGVQREKAFRAYVFQYRF